MVISKIDGAVMGISIIALVLSFGTNIYSSKRYKINKENQERRDRLKKLVKELTVEYDSLNQQLEKTNLEYDRLENKLKLMLEETTNELRSLEVEMGNLLSSSLISSLFTPSQVQ